MTTLFTIRTLFAISFLAITQAGWSQTNIFSYTAKEGLPSNQVYRCVEDNNGFLWVATDAGIARFDGKYFHVFTTDHGLPDNEVLSVVKEVNGRIWVNCFRQSPAYFDEIKNRFINASQDSNLAKVSGTTGMQLLPLHDGGVLYYNELGSHVFKDGKLFQYTIKERIRMPVASLPDGSLVHFWTESKISGDNLVDLALMHSKNGKNLDSVSFTVRRVDVTYPYTDQGKMYFFSRVAGKIYVFSDFKVNPFRCNIDTVVTPEKFTHFDFSHSYYYLIGNSGKVYVYDKQKNVLIKEVTGNYLPNSYYNDSKGNDWISTTDKGLVIYREMPVTSLLIPDFLPHRNFTSIAKKGSTLLTGNYYGEIIEITNGKFSIHKVVNVLPARQRKILVHNGDIYSFSDQGNFVNYKYPLINKITAAPHSGKTGIVWNDTSIIIGYSTGLAFLNTKNRLIRPLLSGKRVTALAKCAGSKFYFGSTDGIYLFDMLTEKMAAVNKEAPNNRVSSLAFSSHGLLWVGTGGQGLHILRNDKLLKTITAKDGLVDNSVRSMAEGEEGTVWVGTNKGISIVSYKLEGENFLYNIRNITANDGLASNEVNDMYFENDTMYVATSDGISILPANIDLGYEEIKLRISAIFANELELPILEKYGLRSNQQNLNIRFAAIDLSGHFKNIQYRLDNNDDWIDLTGNTLNLQLNHGHHTLEARAIDVNGIASDNVLMTGFDIKMPFWKSPWFLLACFVLLQLLLIYMLKERKRKRTRILVEKQVAGLQTASLEQQAFTSLMNPHFIFNALNSVQHYINLQDRQNANRYLSDFASLIRKNFESAQKSFIPLEEELESIRIYLRLEQMRFKSRFDYTIDIGDGIDIDDWMVPTMIIQPLMENAVLHGLMPSRIKGILKLKIDKRGSALEISIEDNGIGLANSRQLRHTGSHKSRSTELISKRLTALNHFANEPVSISISPVSEDPDNPGYRTTIILPFDLYNSWKKTQESERPAPSKQKAIR